MSESTIHSVKAEPTKVQSAPVENATLNNMERTNRKQNAAEAGVNWGTAIAMGIFHIGAIAALFFFTWKAFFVAIFLWW